MIKLNAKYDTRTLRRRVTEIIGWIYEFLHLFLKKWKPVSILSTHKCFLTDPDSILLVSLIALNAKLNQSKLIKLKKM